MRIYQMPNGEWAAVFGGFVTEGLPSREAAIEWVLQKVEELLAGLVISVEGTTDAAEKRSDYYQPAKITIEWPKNYNGGN